MADFLIIEEHTALPRWLTARIGAYLPSRCRVITLCGVNGQMVSYHDITSERGRKKAVLRLQEAQARGSVCGIIGDDETCRAIENKLAHPLFGGRILCASLRLEQLLRSAECRRERIALVGADSMIGRAVAVYLAKRVRFLSLIGKSELALHRLAKCLWQTEGIAVTIGAGRGERIITIDELTETADCLVKRERISSVVAECSIFASRIQGERTYCITARTLAQTAETARAWGISILPKNSASAGQIRLTNAPSKNII